MEQPKYGPLDQFRAHQSGPTWNCCSVQADLNAFRPLQHSLHVVAQKQTLPLKWNQEPRRCKDAVMEAMATSRQRWRQHLVWLPCLCLLLAGKSWPPIMSSCSLFYFLDLEQLQRCPAWHRPPWVCPWAHREGSYQYIYTFYWKHMHIYTISFAFKF